MIQRVSQVIVDVLKQIEYLLVRLIFPCNRADVFHLPRLWYLVPNAQKTGESSNLTFR